MEHLKQFKNFILDSFFPKKCINCKKQGVFLCEDCLSLIEINPFQYCVCEKLIKSTKCPNCQSKYLDEIISAVDYSNRIFKKALTEFNNGINELALPFSFLILSHLSLLEKDLNGFVMMPMNNASRELASILSPILRTEIVSNKTEKKKIILFDLVYENNSSMEEQAKILKQKQAQKVIGLTVARKIY